MFRAQGFGCDSSWKAKRTGLSSLLAVMQVGSGAYMPRHLCPPGKNKHSLPNGLHVEWFEFAPGLGTYMAGASAPALKVAQFVRLHT